MFFAAFGGKGHGRSGGVSHGRKAVEMVQWTISSGERTELKRGAGNPAHNC